MPSAPVVLCPAYVCRCAADRCEHCPPESSTYSRWSCRWPSDATRSVSAMTSHWSPVHGRSRRPTRIHTHRTLCRCPADTGGDCDRSRFRCCYRCTGCCVGRRCTDRLQQIECEAIEPILCDSTCIMLPLETIRPRGTRSSVSCPEMIIQQPTAIRATNIHTLYIAMLENPSNESLAVACTASRWWNFDGRIALINSSACQALIYTRYCSACRAHWPRSSHISIFANTCKTQSYVWLELKIPVYFCGNTEMWYGIYVRRGNVGRQNVFETKVKTNIDPLRLPVIGVIVFYAVKSIVLHEHRTRLRYMYRLCCVSV